MVARAELEIKAQIEKLNRGLDKTQKELKQIRVESQKTSKAMQDNVNKTNQGLQKMTGYLTGILTIGAFVTLTKRIIEVRSEFEKFEAMLKVALGSARAAEREFKKIQDFASQTPFAVRELTESFVKLVNQGFKPTMREMRAMGDLAAAMGKEFIMLTEAIIDAQVGEFERLKEFGIRASKEGDNVTLSFRGVEKQVEFTADAIRQAIIEMGEMEGIMGSMIEVSKTLGGQISNLGDSWTNFLDTLGEKSSGVFSFFITNLTRALNILAEYNELQEGVTRNSKEFMEAFVAGIEALDASERIAVATTEMDIFNEKYMEMNDNVTLFNEVFSKEQIESFEALAVTYRAIRIALSEYIEEQKELLEDDTTEDQAETIETLTKKLKGLNKEKQGLSITDEKRIGEINRETEAIKAQIKEIENLGKALEVKDIVEDIKIIDPDVVDDTSKTATELALENVKEFGKAAVDEEQKRINEETLLAQQEQQRKDAIRDAGFNAASSIVNSLTDLNRQRLDQELADAGDNEEKKAALIREFNQKEQAYAIARTLISGAEAIIKNSAQFGFVPAIPINILQAIQTLAQIAVIKAQKFERGGYEVLKGRRHHQGGVNIPIGEAEEGEGHAVFSREATRKFGKFIPAFVKQINEGKMPGDVVLMEHSVNLDDSKQLEDIKKLLKREQKEVTYQGRYRIEKCGGVTTKIRA